jgi:hypothetical protein
MIALDARAAMSGLRRPKPLDRSFRAWYDRRCLVFGTIVAQRCEEIQHAYLTAFFDFALKGKKEKLLHGPSREFPEVSFGSQV